MFADGMTVWNCIAVIIKSVVYLQWIEIRLLDTNEFLLRVPIVAIADPLSTALIIMALSKTRLNIQLISGRKCFEFASSNLKHTFYNQIYSS